MRIFVFLFNSLAEDKVNPFTGEQDLGCVALCVRNACVCECVDVVYGFVWVGCCDCECFRHSPRMNMHLKEIGRKIYRRKNEAKNERGRASYEVGKLCKRNV